MSRKAEWDVLHAGVQLGDHCRQILDDEYGDYAKTVGLTGVEQYAFIAWLLDNDDGRDMDELYVDYQVVAAAAKDASWPIP